jgi:hypothetical protein
VLKTDHRHFPVVYWSVRGSPGSGDVDRFLADIGKLLQDKRAYLGILDMGELRSMESRELKRMASFVQQRAQELSDTCAGMAILMTTPLVRGILKAFLWFQPLPHPYKVCDTMATAFDYVEAQARSRGLVVPATARQVLTAQLP